MKIMVQVFVALAVAVLLSGWMVPAARATSAVVIGPPACGVITGKLLVHKTKKALAAGVGLTLWINERIGGRLVKLSFYTITGKGGIFTIRKVPPGNYFGISFHRKGFAQWSRIPPGRTVRVAAGSKIPVDMGTIYLYEPTLGDLRAKSRVPRVPTLK